jgi:hypothetical protein
MIPSTKLWDLIRGPGVLEEYLIEPEAKMPGSGKKTEEKKGA